MSDSEPNIPGYTILSQLGQGGICTVYLAEQERMFSRRVALKVMFAEMADQEGFGERFLREARIVSNLNHRNIVHIYDTGQVDGSYYLAMEYLGGGDLSQYKGHALDGSDAVRVVASVLEALDTASSRGVVHRDIKPANIMFREDGTVTLVDFGIAFEGEVDPQLDPSGAMMGTPRYMSPEQIRGLEVDERSDIYSVGAVLFELLAGYSPYNGATSLDIAAKHRFDPIPRLPDDQKAFQSIIDVAMAKDPDERFQNAGAFLSALSSLEGAPFVPGFAVQRGAPIVGKKGAKASSTDAPIGSEDETLVHTTGDDQPTVIDPVDDPEVEILLNVPATPSSTLDRRPRSRTTPIWIGGALILAAIGGTVFLQKDLAPTLSGEPDTEVVASAPADPSAEPETIGIGIGARAKELRETIRFLSPVTGAALEARLDYFDGIIASGQDLSPGSTAFAEWEDVSEAVNEALASTPRNFVVGSTRAEIDAAFDECVQVVDDCQRSWYETEAARPVVLSPFVLTPVEVSIGAFEVFVSSTGYTTEAEQRGYSTEFYRGAAREVEGLSWRTPFDPTDAAAADLPATHISARDASAYCDWLGGRLPTADEWEYASRGPERRLYTWGNEWRPSLAPIRTEYPQVVAALSQDAFFEGLAGLTGNVWEWVTLTDGAFGLKGGSHRELFPVNLRSAAQRDEVPGLTSSDDGIRCAFDANVWPDSRTLPAAS